MKRWHRIREHTVMKPTDAMEETKKESGNEDTEKRKRKKKWREKIRVRDKKSNQTTEKETIKKRAREEKKFDLKTLGAR